MDRRWLLRCAGAAGLASMAGCATRGASMRSDLVEAIDLDGAPGAAFAVIRSGHPVLLAGKGRRGPVDPVAPGPDTIFEIGSLTKTFTACLIFELEVEGRLDVAAPIGRYVPDLPHSWRPLTLDALLSHTSGLPEYLDAGNFLDVMPRDGPPRDLLAIAAERPFTAAPGARHAYNNTGYVLLGLAAEAVGGASYWDQLDQRFFRPAGMSRTGPRNRIVGYADQASGRFWNGEQWNDDPPVTAPGSTFSAGGLLSTARDLARWAVALDRGVLLSPAARARMWRPASLADGAPAGWGYGWLVEPSPHGLIVSHGGGTAGFSCWFRREVEAGKTVVVLTNQNGRADPLVMTRQLLAAMDGMTPGSAPDNPVA